MNENVPSLRSVAKPGDMAPALKLQLVGGRAWQLADQHPPHFTLISFYRGLHCPHCRTYLRTMSQMAAAFRNVGIEPIAISGDAPERAAEAKRVWELTDLPVAYDQQISSMREWGLFVTKALQESHPPIFGEPGLFAIDPTGRIFLASVTSVPFGRPPLTEILAGLTMMIEKKYPARGTA